MALSQSQVETNQNSDLPILSRELKVDHTLKFSNEKSDFKKIIADSVQPVFTPEQKVKKLNEMLQNPVSLPNNYVFATIAEGLYRNEIELYEGENGRDLHGTVVHPDIGNWQLLRVAHDPDSSLVNGYCGAAYWNPDTQQVIIAHCGTKNKGGLYNDFYGVYRNEHVPQIDSAVTFTDEIISVLAEINREKGSKIQLFFTGHSLGAWLSSITAFSAKFLKRNENDCFVSNPGFENSGYHSMSVIFDSPGCKEMLERIQNRLMSRYVRKRKTISSLDITNYLSAPNLINACNLQVGDVYRLFIPLTEEEKHHLESLRNMNFFEAIMRSAIEQSVEVHLVVYTAIMHKMRNIKAVFCPKTGEVLKYNGNLRIQKVIDWPLLISSSDKETLKNKLMQGGKKALEFFQKLSAEVIGMVTATTVLEDLIFGCVSKGLQGVTSAYKSAKWYEDLLHELVNFLRKSNETNNYDPTQVSNSATGRDIRYKTEYLGENYKNAHTLNVFENNELKFLKEYKYLEEYADNELVNLKGVFDALKEDGPPQSIGGTNLVLEVMKILKGCEIDNGLIHSEKVREHIAYIQMMLHLFPDIQQKVTTAYKGLPSEILKKYYNELSESYLSSFKNSLEFKEDTLGLRAFLEDTDQKILHLTKSCTTFEAERTYKTFKMMISRKRKEKQKHFADFEEYHIFLNLSRIFDLRSDVFISYLKKINSKYMLCIECDDAPNCTVRSFFKDLRKMFQKSDDCKVCNFKLILITKKDSNVSRYVRDCFSNEKSIYREEETEVYFDDLTEESREKILGETVLFNGKKVSFYNVVEGCSSLNNTITPEIIVDLHQNKLIEIGTAPLGLGDIENHYIGRKVFKKVKVNCKILYDEKLIESNTLIAISDSSEHNISRLVADGEKSYEKTPDEDNSDHTEMQDDNEDEWEMLDDNEDELEMFDDTFRMLKDNKKIESNVIMLKDNEEEDFKRICKDHPNGDIHWLEKTGDDFIWKKSHGKSLELLRKHVFRINAYSVKSSSVKLIDFNDINSFEEKIIIIAAEPGMGKTTAFTNLEVTWLRNNTKISQWLVRINLIEYKKGLHEKKLFKSVPDVIGFFFGNASQITKNLMESRLAECGDIVFLLDGFDDISSVGQDNILDLVRLLQGTKVERIFISTRLHLRNVLEDTFSTLAYSFKPFFRNDQKEFLQKFWKDDFDPAIDETFRANFIGRVLDYMAESICDKDKRFMGIPLQCRMIAEVYRSVVENRELMDECNFSENFNILELYNRFIEVKYTVFVKVKLGIVVNDYTEEELFYDYAKGLTELHRTIAFKTSFPEDARDFNCDKALSEEEKRKINRIGIAQTINDEPVFIHKTFAEYYVAGFLYDRLCKDKTSEEYTTTINFLKKEFFEKRNEVIRLFLVYHLAKDDLFDAFLARKWKVVEKILSDPQRVPAVDALGRNIWHYVVEGVDLTVLIDEGIGRLMKNIPEFSEKKEDYLGKKPLDYIIHPLLTYLSNKD